MRRSIGSRGRGKGGDDAVGVEVALIAEESIRPQRDRGVIGAAPWRRIGFTVNTGCLGAGMRRRGSVARR